jgi:enoyl-CoA hydratase/carnithine racemase
MPHPAALPFFADEYRLDHLLHHYPKPLLTWGSGIVMGGGLGLIAGASHRVVTETSRIAMPEVTIGLFPDVGASWFLRRVPERGGLFLALTGAQINGADAIFGQLADYFLRSSDRSAVFERLRDVHWSADTRSNHDQLSALLKQFSHDASPPIANLQQHAVTINAMCDGDSLHEIVARITSYSGDDAWLQRAAATLKAGSPTSAALAWELRSRAASLDLAATYRIELIVALQCCAHLDFPEGVRALIIDKDNAPRWQPKTLAEVTPQWLAGHFVAPWPSEQHPLADL